LSTAEQKVIENNDSVVLREFSRDRQGLALAEHLSDTLNEWCKENYSDATQVGVTNTLVPGKCVVFILYTDHFIRFYQSMLDVTFGWSYGIKGGGK
jgi:hypothetical protein